MHLRSVDFDTPTARGTYTGSMDDVQSRGSCWFELEEPSHPQNEFDDYAFEEYDWYTDDSRWEEDEIKGTGVARKLARDAAKERRLRKEHRDADPDRDPEDEGRPYPDRDRQNWKSARRIEGNVIEPVIYVEGCVDEATVQVHAKRHYDPTKDYDRAYQAPRARIARQWMKSCDATVPGTQWWDEDDRDPNDTLWLQWQSMMRGQEMIMPSSLLTCDLMYQPKDGAYVDRSTRRTWHALRQAYLQMERMGWAEFRERWRLMEEPSGTSSEEADAYEQEYREEAGFHDSSCDKWYREEYGHYEEVYDGDYGVCYRDKVTGKYLGTSNHGWHGFYEDWDWNEVIEGIRIDEVDGFLLF